MSNSPLTFLQAAEDVLRRHSPGAPLHFRRIAELAVEDGLIESKGLTPEATMGAQLYTDIKRRTAAGKPQRFKQYGRGSFGLATPLDPLGGAISRHNAEVRQRLRAVLSELNGKDFEILIGNLLAILGFDDVEVTKYSGDGGIDVRATLTVGGVTDVQTAVQVKRWATNVPGRTVRELRGGLGPHERGLVITLSDFTKDARLEAAAPDRTPITLLNGERLLDLLIENDIGVASKTTAILELDEASLFSSEVDAPEEGDGSSSPGLNATSNKYKGSKALAVWPLPGGKHAWKESLEKILHYIAETAPTQDQAIGWIIENFDKVTSGKVARSYLNSVLRPFDLIETHGEQVALTLTGSTYLDDPSKDALLLIARQSVAGFDELLEELEDGSKTTVELLEVLRQELRVTWETDAQVRFRLGWLDNTGKVEEKHGQWSLVTSAD
jgi:restriction system protein